MSRKIKFRGVATVNDKSNNIKVGDFVYGCFVETNIDCQILFGDGEQVSVDRKTVGQFTGLKDKNGVDIYKGDVIKCFNRNYEVKFGECDACIQGSICEVPMLTYHIRGFPLNLLDEYEVLGNKHQNPELLNA